jgi:hypothetical protein
MNATAALKPPVEFPVPELTGLDAAFGAQRKHYLTGEQLGEWGNLGMRSPFHEAAAGLFYKGGKLDDYGLTIRPDLDRGKVYVALRALLGSFDPPHEIKIGTVAVALANWCVASTPA